MVHGEWFVLRGNPPASMGVSAAGSQQRPVLGVLVSMPLAIMPQRLS